MTTIAVMQPYFVPYAGYFRLFAAADIFVVFDCVQFPRRGWVHRNRFELSPGNSDWLTLPIEKCPRDTRIDELTFAAGASCSLTNSLQRFPLLKRAHEAATPLLEKLVDLQTGTVADYLCRQMAVVTDTLGLTRTVIRSSELKLPVDMRGQERVIGIARALGATRYVNSPGGRDLYDATSFSDQGIELRFLEPFPGPMDSVLTLLLSRSPTDVAGLIRAGTILA